MKGKIILAFLLALVALTMIGFVGRNTLTQLINSIKKESEPNLKLSHLKEIIADLREAENSVRTYTITQNPENLTPFYQAATTFDNKMQTLYAKIKNKDQMRLADSMESLIGQKYLIMKKLIDVKKNQDTNKVLERVLDNINRLKERDSIPDFIDSEGFDINMLTYDRIQKVDLPQKREIEQKRSWFQRLFGKSNNDSNNAITKEDEDNNSTEQIASSNQNEKPENALPSQDHNDTSRVLISTTLPDSGHDISSTEIGHIISEIGKEENRNFQAIKNQELRLTTQDVDIMLKVLALANKFEDKEKKISQNRAENAQLTTTRAKKFINITWVATLALFAVLLLIIFNDIRRNQKNKDRLKKAKEKAEKLAKVKEEFLSNMSHEIRTPLNSIIGFTEQLDGTNLNSQQQNYLKSIKHSGGHLLRLINDVLDYAKLESGKLSMEQIGFKVRESIKNVVDSFKTQLSKKGLNVNFHVDADIPQVFIGDPVRFEQILINLLSNAIKFTDVGSIDIDMKLHKIEDKDCYIKLSVTDSGIGIPEEKLNSIFKDFSQVDSSVTRKYGGTGLGLSIVKKIVKILGGNISLSSKEGEGTTFLLDLRYDIGSEADLSELKKATIDYSKLKGHKIMVVDDQEYNLELIKVIFDKWGIVGTLISSGQEAIEDFKANQYDLIFMDMHMPELSGIETAKAIRELENDTRTPIIALTAATSQEESDKCLEAGMDDCLLKPFTQKELFETISNTLLGQEAAESITEKEQTPVVEKKSNLDLSDLEMLADGDPTFIVNMLTIFINNFSIDLKEMKEAIANKELGKAGKKAHKMASPSRHLGFSELASILKEIEMKSEDESNFTSVEELIQKVDNLYHIILPEIESEISNQKESEPTA
ncbi:ATP-binding protein [Fulvivirga sediminis]|uniref:histidine kinase n=1 Tax=Fulvivirga sediminis TaxID=2803949 RepID=A0A937F7V1_9BACT|nr:ATP-binding protein [Fulvivirga sediminis]MBL3656632.1 response regulator [Fulvivirga sediminis]